MIFSVYVLFQLTIGQKIKNYETRLENILYNKEKREQIIEKVKEEIKTANQKENLLTPEERVLLSDFINKIQKELSLGKTQ